jgi:hypothetical protein
MPSGAVVAELTFLVRESPEREEQEARLAEELVGSAGNDARRAINPIIGIRVLFFEVFFVVVERGYRGAFLEEHVERLFDVVGVQFLLEVDDAVVFFVLDGLGGGVVGDHRDRNLGIELDVVVEQVDVVSVLDVGVDHEVVVERVVVFHELVLELGIGAVFEIFVAHRGSERVEGRGI